MKKKKKKKKVNKLVDECIETVEELKSTILSLKY